MKSFPFFFARLVFGRQTGNSLIVVYGMNARDMFNITHTRNPNARTHRAQSCAALAFAQPQKFDHLNENGFDLKKQTKNLNWLTRLNWSDTVDSITKQIS